MISELSATILEDFTLREFKSPLSPQRVIEEILKAGYAVPEDFIEFDDELPEVFSDYSDGNASRALDLINIILELTEFVDEVIKVRPNLTFSNEVKNLISETQSFRKLEFNDLSYEEKRSIKTLNRLILEEVHPDVTPKGSRTSSFSKKYGINFADISRSTYISILRKLIADGKIQVKKEGQANLYPVLDKELISNLARLISEHMKKGKRKSAT